MRGDGREKKDSNNKKRIKGDRSLDDIIITFTMRARARNPIQSHPIQLNTKQDPKKTNNSDDENPLLSASFMLMPIIFLSLYSLSLSLISVLPCPFLYLLKKNLKNKKALRKIVIHDH